MRVRHAVDFVAGFESVRGGGVDCEYDSGEVVAGVGWVRGGVEFGPGQVVADYGCGFCVEEDLRWGAWEGGWEGEEGEGGRGGGVGWRVGLGGGVVDAEGFCCGRDGWGV